MLNWNFEIRFPYLGIKRITESVKKYRAYFSTYFFLCGKYARGVHLNNIDKENNETTAYLS